MEGGKRGNKAESDRGKWATGQGIIVDDVTDSVALRGNARDDDDEDDEGF